MNAPTGWLNTSRYEQLEVTEMEVRTAEFSGVLRGVQRIEWAKLARAMECSVVTLASDKPGEPNFLVIPPAGSSESDWVKYYPEDPEGEYVNIYDRDMQRCHCEDFIWRGEAQKTPCKHVLAVLVHIQHPQILPFIDELRARNAIAEVIA